MGAAVPKRASAWRIDGTEPVDKLLTSYFPAGVGVGSSFISSNFRGL